MFLKQISYTRTVPISQVYTHLTCPDLAKDKGSRWILDIIDEKLNNHYFYFININLYALALRSKNEHLQECY